MKTTLYLALALVLGATALPAGAQQVKSLRSGDASIADKAPESLQYQGGRPGNQRLVTRTFQGQPPVIPHSIENIDEITVGENPCLECHITDEFRGKKMPRVPDSHLIPGKKDEFDNPLLQMTRYQCNSCHAPQVNAKPLVDNNFRGLPQKPAARTSAAKTAAK